MSKKEEEKKELVLASWSDRFLAWLIDFIIVGFIAQAVTASIVLTRSGSFFSPGLGEFFTTFSLQSVGFFLYWTYMESVRGQSLGKSVLKLMVVSKSGVPIDFTKSAIQSFGKSFLLPIDVIIGYLLFDEHRQRLFAKLAETVVIKLHVDESVKDVKYVKE
ncbi:MAG: RDD family protein [Nitrososphaerales archaeon]